MAEADAQTPPGQTPPPATPFDRIGGKAVIAVIVDRFYDLMDADPTYAELRAMHAPDLSPMRSSLTDFLVAWMGGPRTWFDDRPGACVMSAHAKLGVSNQTATQWVLAMKQAVEETVDDPPFVEALLDAFARMAKGMTRPE